MGYFLSSCGDSVFLLDTSTRKCGVFRNNTFDGFCTWLDKTWVREVGVVGVLSLGSLGCSVILGDESLVLREGAMSVAKRLRGIEPALYRFGFRGNVNNKNVNGFLFIYNSVDAVRRLRCHF